MPCTLEPWEIEYEEKEYNREKYGVDLTDEQLMTRLLCEAVRLITRNAERRIWFDEEASKELKAWAKGHAAQDRKKRNAERRKRRVKTKENSR
jgi:hypothetical protein